MAVELLQRFVIQADDFERIVSMHLFFRYLVASRLQEKDGACFVPASMLFGSAVVAPEWLRKASFALINPDAWARNALVPSEWCKSPAASQDLCQAPFR